MRRSRSVLWMAALAAACAGLTVCTPRTRNCVPSGSGSNGGVAWAISDCTIVVSNSLLELRWDAATGALAGIRNLTTGTDLLSGFTHSAWSAAVAPTDDIWSARTGHVTPGGPTALASFAARPLDGGGFTFDLTFTPTPQLQVVQHVTVLDDEPVAHWTTDVTAAPGTTVVSISSPELLGVARMPGEQLAWPWHEGLLVPAPGTDLRTMSYPAAASMQWMELFTPSEGIYLGVLDSTGSYKELTFGFDPALGLVADTPREMAVAFYGYATAQHGYTTPEVEVGVASVGGWYWGADRYRSFLAKSGMTRKLPKMARELRGWRRGFSITKALTSPSRKKYSYCKIAPLLMPPAYTDQTGISLLALYGWHYDGLDTFYPDYDFLGKDAKDPTCLQGSDLAASMQALAARPQPNGIMFYMNAHIADPASDWFKDPSHAAAQALGPDGQPYLEYYPTQPGRPYRVMCPMAKAWADRLDAKAMELRTLAPAGARAFGVYWDQAEEVPATPCYDRTHGHSNPHSAFPEGYRALFERLNADFSLSGTDTEYVFAAEGANDYYSQFIDVAGGMPGRPLGYAPQRCDEPISTTEPHGVNWPCGARHAPELGRYTMSARFLGLANFSGKLDANDTALPTNFGTPEEYTRAFLLGDAFRTMEVGAYSSSSSDAYASINRHAFPRYTNIYASEPEIYFYGTYVDAKGLTLDAAPTDVMATLIVGARRDRIGVQMWNQTGADRTVRVQIQLDLLGLAGPATGVVDLEGATSPQASADGASVAFEATVPSHDVKAFKVSM